MEPLCGRLVFEAADGRQLRNAVRRLTIGAYQQTAPPFQSAGGVRAYHPSGAYDESTVFEVDGRLYKNSESIVRLGPFALRNAPVFVPLDGATAEQAMAEIEALLDQLVAHPNTAPFFAQRLIQKLVSSNPSGDYVADVARAFRTGFCQGIRFSGRYGDVGAAVAAVLLHGEARQVAAASGGLREPLLRLAHFLRAMEYESTDGREIAVSQLDDLIGQWPHFAPSVFNFYSPFFRPSGFDAAGVDGALVGPEFQLNMPPNAINLLNGLMDAIEHGELTHCGADFGMTYWACRRGGFFFRLNQSSMGGTSAEQLETLDLLLTAGRLSARSRATVQTAYNSAEAASRLKAAQSAIVLTPEFNTLGRPLVSGVRAPAPAPLQSAPRSYKAVVMIFLHGGADIFNMLVPMECGLWNEYRSVREGVALSEGQLLRIPTVGQRCSSFGVHHALPFVQQLYNAGQAAFVSNIGALVHPTTAEEFRRGNVTLCKNLFSHSDQQNAASTLKCQVPGTQPGGVGGRMADALAADGYTTSAFSLEGRETWPEGRKTQAMIVHQSKGVPRLSRYQSLSGAVANISRTRHDNIYCEEYVRQLIGAIQSSEGLGAVFEKTTLVTDFATNHQNSDIGQQLAQVAKPIASRAERKAEREVFYVQQRGYDMHGEVLGELRVKFEQLNFALQKFVEEMRAQGAWDNVVMATSSDFARTLTSNGRGTDHAWAGNHVVLGGKVRGRRVYNDFPATMQECGEQDIGRGRLAPKYPWESMMVPIAAWMGVKEPDLDRVFPNRRNFKSTHVLSESALFAP